MHALELDQRLAGRVGRVEWGIDELQAALERKEREATWKMASQPGERWHFPRPGSELRQSAASLARATGNGPTQQDPGRIVSAETSIDCGTGMSGAFYEWLKGSVAGSRMPKNVAVVGLTNRYQVIRRLEFASASIRRITFPALDASSGDAAYLTVEIAPDAARVRESDASGASLGRADLRHYSMPHAKKWRRCDFRLRINGLEEECQRVGRIEPISSDHNLLVITISSRHADGFYAWHEDVVIKGHSAGTDRAGDLDFLAPDMGTTYFSVGLKNLKIIRMSADKSGGEGSIGRVKVEMYYSDMNFHYFGPATLG